MGIPLKEMAKVAVLIEEYEVLRLLDYEGLSQEAAAEKMNISRPTLTRIYESARNKVAQAFIEGRAIIFEGGNVVFEENWYRCLDCHTLYAAKQNNTDCITCNSAKVEDINAAIKQWGRQGRQRGRNQKQKGL